MQIPRRLQDRSKGLYTGTRNNLKGIFFPSRIFIADPGKHDLKAGKANPIKSGSQTRSMTLKKIRISVHVP